MSVGWLAVCRLVVVDVAFYTENMAALKSLERLDLNMVEIWEQKRWWRTTGRPGPTDRPTRWRGADLGGRTRRPAEAGGGPEGPNITKLGGEEQQRRRLLPEQLHLKTLDPVTRRASLKTAATSSHCVQFNRNTSKLLETVLVGAESVDNVEEMVGNLFFCRLGIWNSDSEAELFSSGPKGLFLSSHTEVELFCRRFQTFAKTLQPRIQGSGGNQTFLPPAQTESTGSFTVFPNLILQLVSSLCWNMQT